jgi:hypothetical protein
MIRDPVLNLAVAERGSSWFTLWNVYLAYGCADALALGKRDRQQGKPSGSAVHTQWWTWSYAPVESVLVRRAAVHSPEELRQLALGDPRMWLVVSARYFQTLGFYTEHLDLPNDLLLDTIKEAVRWHWDGPLPPEEVASDMQLADMILLLGDRSRVWWRDLEGVFAGEDAYVTTLTEWATISRGAFAPEQIIERWHSDDGPADIDFMLGSQRYRVAHPNLRDDFLNIAILSDINRLIGDSGYHFAVCDNLGMPNWVVALTREEEDRLRHDRGWSFLAL